MDKTGAVPAAGKRPLVLSAEMTAQLFDWEDAIRCIAETYAREGDAAMYPRRVVARGSGVWLRALAAVSPSGRYMGAKVFGLGREGGASYLVALFEQDSGALAALVDGNYLTAVRTAATSAVAVDRMARPGPATLAVLGSGSEAQAHLRAVNTVRTLEQVRVFSPTSANRERFAASFTRELGIACHAAGSAQEAVAEADLVVAAARSHDEKPILRGAWLRPGMTIVSVGSTLPEQREIDSEVVARCDRIIADAPEEVDEETGDMQAARAAGVSFEAKLGSLADLMCGRQLGRASNDEITMYKSVGAAIQDVAVAEMCLRNAERDGLGEVLSTPFSIKSVRAPQRRLDT